MYGRLTEPDNVALKFISAKKNTKRKKKHVGWEEERRRSLKMKNNKRRITRDKEGNTRREKSMIEELKTEERKSVQKDRVDDHYSECCTNSRRLSFPSDFCQAAQTL